MLLHPRSAPAFRPLRANFLSGICTQRKAAPHLLLTFVREKRAPFWEVGEISSWLFGEEPFSITINVDYFFANFREQLPERERTISLSNAFKNDCFSILFL
jgi:hypothetical protein